MTEISSTVHGIRVPHQTVGQANQQKLENLLENDELLAQFEFVGEDAKTAWQSLNQAVMEKAKGPSQEMIDQQIARQNAVPVHSVFRANGNIVAVVNEQGSISSANGLGHVDTTGTPDQIAQNVYDRLSQLYGNVQMETYPAGSHVNVGMAEGEMFGRTPRIPSPDSTSQSEAKSGYMNSLFKISAESLALFQEARKTFGF